MLRGRRLSEFCEAVRSRPLRTSPMFADFGRRKRKAGHGRVEGAREERGPRLRRRTLLSDGSVRKKSRSFL